MTTGTQRVISTILVMASFVMLAPDVMAAKKKFWLRGDRLCQSPERLGKEACEARAVTMYPGDSVSCVAKNVVLDGDCNVTSADCECDVRSPGGGPAPDLEKQPLTPRSGIKK